MLGHELAHFTHRHTLRDLRTEARNRQVGAISDGVLGVAAVGLGPLGLPLFVLGDLAVGVGMVAATTGYSRDVEREADRLGFAYTSRAGYDPAAGARVFERMRAELVAEGIDEPYFFGSHPRLAERVESYQEMAAAHGAAGGDAPREAYERAIHAVLLENAGLDLSVARWASARAAVERHLAIDDASPDGWYWQGELARRVPRPPALDEADGHYRRALGLAPDHHDANLAMGLLLRERGRHDAARPYLERYLAGDPAAVDREIVAYYLEDDGR